MGNRVPVWLVVGAVAVVVLCYLALSTRVTREPEREVYHLVHIELIARKGLAHTMTAFDNPLTSVVDEGGGKYRVTAIITSKHPDLAVNTKNSPTGELKVIAYLEPAPRGLFEQQQWRITWISYRNP